MDGEIAMFVYTKSIKELPRTQILVLGAGSAGATAAITASRMGASVTLLERYGFMGGLSTQVLDTFYGFFLPGQGMRKIVGGVPDAVVNDLFRLKSAIYRPNTYGAGQGITYDPHILKIVWEQLATHAGVKIFYHTLIVDVLVKEGEIEGVIAAGKDGLFLQRADIIIDATGDAVAAALAGVPYESAKDGPVQSLTTTFKLLNVDVERAIQIKKSDLHALMTSATGYDLPRKEGSIHLTPLPGVMTANMTRVTGVDPNDMLQLSKAEIEGRRQALEYTRFLIEHVPGYEKATLGELSVQIGIRESRRIIGEYRLTREDVLLARKFDDVIAQCGAPIEEHHSGADTRWEYVPEGETYHIPLRVLIPQKISRMLVAGRCLSADHDAHASVRSMGQCMAMGQAAGTAAVISVRENSEPRSLNITHLQDALRTIGAIID